MTTKINAQDREDIEALLPWHAAGTLSRSDSERVEAALENDRELARRYDLVREEKNETVHLNEALGAPSARAADRLFAAIEAEGSPKKAPNLGIGAWFGEALASLSPRALGWSAAAAALAIVLQAGVIASYYAKDRGLFGTASLDPVATKGAFALVRFNPSASAADISKFLSANKAEIVKGPGQGDLYRVRISDTPLQQDALAQAVAKLAAERSIVETILPAQ